MKVLLVARSVDTELFVDTTETRRRVVSKSERPDEGQHAGLSLAIIQCAYHHDSQHSGEQFADESVADRGAGGESGV